MSKLSKLTPAEFEEIASIDAQRRERLGNAYDCHDYIPRLFEHITVLSEELSAVNQRIEALEKALKPFAMIWHAWRDFPPEKVPATSLSFEVWLVTHNTFLDKFFRRAAEVLDNDNA